MNKLWNSLQNKAKKYRKISISELFVSDAQRVQKFSKSMSNLYIDFSKSLISQDILKNFDQISKKLKIEKQFYHHFCDIIMESIKTFSITESELKARMRIVNKAFVDSYYDKGKSIILVSLKVLWNK